MPPQSLHVRYREQSGRHLLAVSISPFDPARVKTRLGEGRAELFSQLPSSESGYQYNRLLHRRNRDGSSTRKLRVGVFTQPGPATNIGHCEGVVVGITERATIAA